ncbi:MAG TPA: hypothetical protein VIT00_02380 [Terrimicrobiaceae bacterium]
MRDTVSLIKIVSLVIVFEPGNHPQRDRLAATRWAYQDHELAVFDVEADVFKPP